MKDATTRNEIDHIYTIVATLIVIYALYVNHLYDFRMFEHALTVDLFVVSFSSIQFVQMNLDLECDRRMITQCNQCLSESEMRHETVD